VAYKTEIQIGVKGVAELDKLRKQVTSLNQKVDGIENAFSKGIQSVKRYSDAVRVASDTLRKARINTQDETDAIRDYVTAVGAANAAQVRQNRLIDQEIAKRGLATQELKKYNAAAAGPRQSGSMAGQYLRPGQARGTTQFAGPIGPGPASSILGGQSSAVEGRIKRILEIKKGELQLERALIGLQQKSRGLDAAAVADNNRILNIKAEEIAKNNEIIRQEKVKQSILRKRQKLAAAGRGSGGSGKGSKSGALQTAGEFGLGTGFPLLFGGGAGQVIGGGLGTALAGAFGLAGQAAMGLQIGLSAIIGKAEELITRFKDVGNAINSLSMDALASSFITVTEEARTLVRQLVEAGNAQAAVSVAANETFKQTGVLPEAVGDITNNLNLLSNVWDEVVGTVSGLVSILATPFLTALTLILKGVAEAFKFVNLIASGIGIVLKRAVELINLIPGMKPILDAIGNATKGIVEEEEKSLAALAKKTEGLDREYAQNKKLFDIEKDRTGGRTAAEKLINAEIDHRKDSEKLSVKTQGEILALNQEYGHVTDRNGQIDLAYSKMKIEDNAKLEQQAINRTLELKKQSIELDRQREIEKIAKEQLKEKIQQHKIAQGAIQAQTTLLDGQIQIFNLQAQAAQSVFAVTQARNEAELSALKLEESRLQRQLANLQRIDGFYNKQRDIIDKIAKNRKKQAEIEFKVAGQSIKQMVTKAELERQAVRFQVQKIDLQIELLRLQAEEIEDTQKKLESLARINQQAKISAEIAKQMTISADKSLASAKEIAKYQLQSAKHLRDGKLESIEAERVDARRAVHAAAIARSAKAAASATSSGSGSDAMSSTQTMSTSRRIDADVHEEVLRRAPAFGYKNPLDLINALDKAQANKDARIARDERIAQKASSSIGAAQMGSVSTRAGSAATKAGLAMIGEKGPEYVVPEKKAAAFATNYLMGARGAGAIPRYAEGGYTGSINIQTGPVMQQDNQTYLTMGQFEEGMRELTESLARGGRSYGSRQFQGIS